MAETLAHFRHFGIPIELAMPRIFVAIRVNLSVLLDLSSGDIRRRLGISGMRLSRCDWRKEATLRINPITQLVGAAAFEVGFEGLIAPSATLVKGLNLIWFPRKVSPKSVRRI
jgi:hypothetical protein